MSNTTSDTELVVAGAPVMVPPNENDTHGPDTAIASAPVMVPAIPVMRATLPLFQFGQEMQRRLEEYYLFLDSLRSEVERCTGPGFDYNQEKTQSFYLLLQQLYAFEGGVRTALDPANLPKFNPPAFQPINLTKPARISRPLCRRCSRQAKAHSSEPYDNLTADIAAEVSTHAPVPDDVENMFLGDPRITPAVLFRMNQLAKDRLVTDGAPLLPVDRVVVPELPASPPVFIPSWVYPQTLIGLSDGGRHYYHGNPENRWVTHSEFCSLNNGHSPTDSLLTFSPRHHCLDHFLRRDLGRPAGPACCLYHVSADARCLPNPYPKHMTFLGFAELAVAPSLMWAIFRNTHIRGGGLRDATLGSPAWLERNRTPTEGNRYTPGFVRGSDGIVQFVTYPPDTNLEVKLSDIWSQECRDHPCEDGCSANCTQIALFRVTASRQVTGRP